VLGAMETGYQRGKIQEESLLYEHRKHDGSYPIVGVNTFRNAMAEKGGEPIRINKRVHFFLMRYVRGDVRDHDHESDDARWFRIEQGFKLLKFATERKMVHRAMAMLTARQNDRRPPAAQGNS